MTGGSAAFLPSNPAVPINYTTDKKVRVVAVSQPSHDVSDQMFTAQREEV